MTDVCFTSGGTWDPRSKKVFGLQENFEPTSCTFVEKSVVVNPALFELYKEMKIYLYTINTINSNIQKVTNICVLC